MPWSILIHTQYNARENEVRNSEARQCCDLSTTENRADLQNCRSNGECWREVYCALVTLTSGWTISASAYRFDINILEFHCPVQFPIPQHFILHLSHAFIAYSELSPHVMFCSVCCCPLSARTRYTSRPSFEVTLRNSLGSWSISCMHGLLSKQVFTVTAANIVAIGICKL